MNKKPVIDYSGKRLSDGKVVWITPMAFFSLKLVVHGCTKSMGKVKA